MIKFSAMVKDGGISVSSMTKKPRLYMTLDGSQTRQWEELLAFKESDKAAKLTLKGDKGTNLVLSAGIWKLRTSIGGGLEVTFELQAGLSDVVGKLAKSSIALEMFSAEVEEDDRFAGFSRNKSRTSTWTPAKRAIPN